MKPPALQTAIRAILCLCLIGAVALYARAGGGGGSSSSHSSSSSSSHSSSSYSSHSYSGGSSYHSTGSSSSGGGGFSFGTVVIILIIIAAVILFNFMKAKKLANTTAFSQLSKHASKPFESVDGAKAFLAANPDFKVDAFLAKVRTAFTEVQSSWSAQKPEGMRRFISDGVYQRFAAQFKMMQLLKQTNPLSNIRIQDVWVDAISQDGGYDIFQVGIEASMDDSFVCELDHDLDESGSATFTEFWSFLRKKGAPSKDIYHSEQCPNCSAPLPKDMGEVGKCNHCNATINSGSFDWVLSEITQEADYHADSALEMKAPDLSKKVHGLTAGYGDFSVQLAEDKASNAYMQILTAKATRDPQVLRRFVSDELFSKLEHRVESQNFVYNRLFLNRVTLVGARKDGDKNVLAIALTCSSQRARIQGEGVELLDPEISTGEEYLLLSRDAVKGDAKGSIYQHQCTACGGPVKNTLDIKCQYCGSALNSTAHDWVVSGLMSRGDYLAYVEANKSTFAAKMDPALMDKLFSVKDYALNNLMVIFAADGNYKPEEKALLEEMAGKMGISPDGTASLVAAAQSNRLQVKMPDDLAARKSIFELMKQGAMADGSIAPQEQAVLDWVENTYVKTNPTA